MHIPHGGASSVQNRIDLVWFGRYSSAEVVG